jgi:hypothetical protein
MVPAIVGGRGRQAGRRLAPAREAFTMRGTTVMRQECQQPGGEHVPRTGV